MIQHIVVLKFKAHIEESTINAALMQLDALRELIPSMKHFSWGKNCSPEHLNKGFSHVFIMSFEHAEGRNAYLSHPEHKRIATEGILPILENGLESTLVIDYEPLSLVSR